VLASALVLEVRNLTVRFPGGAGPVTVVDGVDLAVHTGERVGIVGESGSGKSVTLLSLLGLIDPPGEVGADLIRINGKELPAGDVAAFKRARGRDVALVMQDPLSALSPLFTVGNQLVETIRTRRPISPRDAAIEAVVLLDAVGIPDAPVRAHDYPHQLSGGMRQRVAIALALACEPVLLVADEPTTALDVTIRAQVIELLHRLSVERAMAVVMVTHDFGVLAGFADTLAVMYAGRVVEEGTTDAVYRDPVHPYTRALLASQPRISGPARGRLPVIPGQPPDPARRPAGCPFHPRCPVTMGRARCRRETPALRSFASPVHRAACHFAEELMVNQQGSLVVGGPR
jgi:oligopeptide/dipeptide ABC transporter ATP-binding protein